MMRQDGRWLASGAAGLLVLAVAASTGVATAGQGTLVVLNKAEASASLIDLDAGVVVATIPTGEGPHEVAVSPDGQLAVATSYGTDRAPGSTLAVIDLPGAKAVKTVDLGEYGRPHGIVWLKDGRHVLVTAEAKKAVITVDVATGSVTRAVETGQEISHMLAVAPDGSRAFVANIGSGSVTAIDLEKAERIANIGAGEGAEGIDITPDGREVWITNRAADTVTVIDASSLEVLKELRAGSFPIRAKATPDGRHVLVSNARSGDMSVFDVATKGETRRIPMKLEVGETEGRLFGGRFGSSSVPIGILIRPDGKRAYVAHANADVVSIVDLETWEVTGSLRPGKEPDGLGFSPLSVDPEARDGGAAVRPGPQARADE